MLTSFRETLAPGLVMEVEGRLLASGRSPHQAWEVWQTPAFGRLYRLDNRSMAAEADSHLCHEPLVHVAGLAHPGPQRALVLGGGDGASCAELLRYPTLREIVLAELDPAVLALAREWLPALHAGALDDARVTLRLGDAQEVVAAWQPGDEPFDLVIFDLTDPDTAAAPLFSTAFFRACRRLLTPDGALCLHLGSPHWQAAQCVSLLARLREVFRELTPVRTSILLYGGAWALVVASDTLKPASLDPALLARRLARLGGGLRLIDASRYHALLAGALLPASTAP